MKHKVCKQGAPIEKDVTKEVETCAVTSKEVCKITQRPEKKSDHFKL